MENKPSENRGGDLPACAAEFIRQIGRRMRYRKKAAEDVQAELTAHFEDELRGCTNAQEREQRVQRLISEFGDARLLAILCRRAKKRCRPAWAKAIVRTAQGAGVLLLLFVFYTIWFVSGKPAPRMDYMAMLNQMSRPEIAERDNAWPHYEKAIAALVEPNNELEQTSAFQRFDHRDLRESSDLPPEVQQAITQWVEKNEAAIREFAAAAVMPYSRRQYAHDPNATDRWLLGVLLPHLQPLRTLARLTVWRSRMDLERGDTQRAIEGCLAAARAGRHWQSGEILVEQLFGLGMSRLAHQEILEIVHARSLSAAELASMQRELAVLYPERYPLLHLEGERLAILDTIQHVFTDSGPGGGHVAFSGAMALSGFVMTGSRDNDPEVVTVPIWTAMSMVHARRNNTVAKANWLFDQQAEYAKLSPYERHVRKTPAMDELLRSLPQYRYAVIHILAPALSRATDLAFRGKASHEATVTILALQRYRQEKGSYPASLDELKQAGYINALPADPYSDGSLVYKPSEDHFTLYSVGMDFRDDGGAPGKDSKGRPTMWEVQTGDSVFWPMNP